MASYHDVAVLPASEADPMPVDSDIEADVDQLYSEPEGDDGGASRQPGAGSRSRALGHSLLPMSRLENMIQADGITGSLTMSKEAIFLISIATEAFIKRLAQGGLDQAKSQDRQAVQYDDMAAAILQYQEFRFLEEFIPTPIPLDIALLERENIEAKVFDEEPIPAPKPTNPMPTPYSVANTSSTSKFRVSTSTNGTKARANGSRNGQTQASAQASTSGPSGSSTVLDARPWNHSSGVVPTSYWSQLPPAASLTDQPLDSLKQYLSQRFPDIPPNTPTPELLDILSRRGILPRIDSVLPPATISQAAISQPPPQLRGNGSQVADHASEASSNLPSRSASVPQDTPSSTSDDVKMETA